ncbi:hypothetical protein CEXT_337931 [Caerostris extrusa]|uniref:Uncharacterized protein n=1 Tax=Caerostris extrusa TaxID=172846 RepID=A0AAV4W664_CAEEX|nr:hypothetical protein CEXT_337931 [Caerostris extrusa]
MDGFDEVDHHCLVTFCASSEIVFGFSRLRGGINGQGLTTYFPAWNIKVEPFRWKRKKFFGCLADQWPSSQSVTPPFLMDGFDEVDHHCLATLWASSEIVFWFCRFRVGINAVKGN